MFIFLTVLQALIGAAMVAVILVQKSEGGGLGTGGSPTGFMSARGAADFLTRTTQVLAGLFVLLSIVLAALAVKSGGGETVDTSLVRNVPAAVPSAAPTVAPSAPASTAPAAADPLAPAAKQ
ncbi:MAG TPA: preprotein translocase subunit SecG [Novosphingobium sp.]|nr:preprotein translocase subunit SecG [Novosphingobium sp.]HZV09786.1 preprotein translocase subunit SecG [Novosphingobium sp.]